MGWISRGAAGKSYLVRRLLRPYGRSILNSRGGVWSGSTSFQRCSSRVREEANTRRMSVVGWAVSAMRPCRVSVTGLDGVTHSVDVQASSLFEAASIALTAFRQQSGWATEALTPNVRFRVEVQQPATVHDVPLKAIEQWRRSPTTSPRDYVMKRRAGADEKL